MLLTAIRPGEIYLSEPMVVGAFVYLLSVHLNVCAQQLESVRIAVTLALQDAAEAGESASFRSERTGQDPPRKRGRRNQLSVVEH